MKSIPAAIVRLDAMPHRNIHANRQGTWKTDSKHLIAEAQAERIKTHIRAMLSQLRSACDKTRGGR